MGGHCAWPSHDYYKVFIAEDAAGAADSDAAGELRPKMPAMFKFGLACKRFGPDCDNCD